MFDIAVSGSYAYVVAAGGDAQHGVLIFLDVSDPSSPVEVGPRIPLGGQQRVEAFESYVYVFATNNTLVFDATDPVDLGGPFLLPGGTQVRSIAVVGSHGFIVSRSGLRVMDVAEPAAAFEVGRYFPPPPTMYQAVDVAVSGPHAYYSQDRHGLGVIDVSSCWAINPGHPGVPEFPDLPPQEE